MRRIRDFVIGQCIRLLRTIRGFYYAVRYDHAMQLHLIIGAALLIIGRIFWPLSDLQVALLVLGFILLLVTELQNTALEIALDRLHPERHESIKRSKDIAAASVLLAAAFLGVVVFWIGYGDLLH